MMSSRKDSPLFYYFGLWRGKRIFTLSDPIFIAHDFAILDFDMLKLKEYLQERQLNGDEIVEEFGQKRGLLFGAAATENKAAQFLSQGKFLSPSAIGGPFTVYFLDNKELVLLKMNKHFTAFGAVRKEVWNLLKPLGLISETEFKEQAKEWQEKEEDCSICERTSFALETKRVKVFVGRYYSLFVGIKMNNYAQLKKKCQAIYKTPKN
ncbi:MAG: hypothetical protein Q8R53_03775 [Nanoarchaeota archaeon]|nr:hypothetical protein [Nanoarchaeota archaeon]